MKYVLIGMWRIMSTVIALPVILWYGFYSIGRNDAKYLDEFLDKYFKWLQ